jgi:hypothetical protein
MRAWHWGFIDTRTDVFEYGRVLIDSPERNAYASLAIRDRHRVDCILMNTDSQLIDLVQRSSQRAPLSVKPHDVKQQNRNS